MKEIDTQRVRITQLGEQKSPTNDNFRRYFKTRDILGGTKSLIFCLTIVMIFQYFSAEYNLHTTQYIILSIVLLAVCIFLLVLLNSNFVILSRLDISKGFILMTEEGIYFLEGDKYEDCLNSSLIDYSKFEDLKIRSFGCFSILETKNNIYLFYENVENQIERNKEELIKMEKERSRKVIADTI